VKLLKGCPAFGAYAAIFSKEEKGAIGEQQDRDPG
jgi:hypothetical protein